MWQRLSARFEWLHEFLSECLAIDNPRFQGGHLTDWDGEPMTDIDWQIEVVEAVGVACSDAARDTIKEVSKESIAEFFTSCIFTLNRWSFVPTNDSAQSTLANVHTLPPGYPEFQPIMYATENVLPVVKLGQDQNWSPNANDRNRARYWSLMITRWLLIFAGWAQGLILVSAISGRFRSS
jgi:hypothetical protein